MKKYTSSTFKKTTLLIVSSHLVFLVVVVLFGFRIMLQEKEMMHNTLIFNTKNTLLEHELTLFFSSIKNSLLVLSLLIGISLISYLVFIKNNFFYPIKLITSALETGSKKCIKILKTIPGEFEHIGNLFQENDNHKFELLSAKIKAEESEKLKSTFLENLSHEIRTPMNAIIGFTDLLLTSNLSNEEKNEYLSIINKSGKSLVSIIEDLIVMSKIDANQIEPNYVNINLDTCLVEIYKTIKVEIPNSKNIDFSIIESNTRLFYDIKVDEVKLKQILVNLIYNAVKFTDKGSVSFGYNVIEESDLEFIEFKVIDTGIGISKENQKIIFERFKRVESDLTIEKGGLGLGLSISKAYVEMMGGSIAIESDELNGTVFTFRIPLKYDKTLKNNQQDVLHNFFVKSNDKKTILIAEDDNINFLLIKKMLQVTDYEIIRAENGQIAVEKALENPAINLVLMDIKMPVMNGYESFEKINASLPNLKIIAQTAHASQEDKEKIIKMGFTDYITKPINKELLIDMVTKCCI